jgi:hypothetical protein
LDVSLYQLKQLNIEGMDKWNGKRIAKKQIECDRAMSVSDSFRNWFIKTTLVPVQWHNHTHRIIFQNPQWAAELERASGTLSGFCTLLPKKSRK